jgi:[ribosomal protein S5]-alanine N-acetyltransferase
MLISDRFILSKFTNSDVSEEYIDWLNTKEINQYLESRLEKQTKKTCCQFLKNIADNNYFFSIKDKINKRHIGNIKLGPINYIYKRAVIGILIGDQSYWRKGVASEVIRCICTFAFKELDLNKIEAGAYKDNIGSIKAFEKCGFSVEGKLKEHVKLNNNFHDIYLFGITKKKWMLLNE